MCACHLVEREKKRKRVICTLRSLIMLLNKFSRRHFDVWTHSTATLLNSLLNTHTYTKYTNYIRISTLFLFYKKAQMRMTTFGKVNDDTYISYHKLAWRKTANRTRWFTICLFNEKKRNNNDILFTDVPRHYTSNWYNKNPLRSYFMQFTYHFTCLSCIGINERRNYMHTERKLSGNFHFGEKRKTNNI